MTKANAIVYVDGFNLYYNLLRDRFTDCKWLDLRAMAETLYPEYTISRVRYFTARVSPPAHDPAQGRRQQVYLRALRATDVCVDFGKFRRDKRTLARIDACACEGCSTPLEVAVHLMKEKRSDVNLATALLLDAFRKDAEVAIVLTNDTDHVAPLRAAREELGIRIELLSPCDAPANELRKAADGLKRLRHGVLRECQLPLTLSDAKGNVERPRAWRPEHP